MKRLLLILLSSLSGFVAVRVLSRGRGHRWTMANDAQAEQIIEQMKAHNKGKNHGPLDPLVIMADIQEWLNEINEGRK